MRMFGLMMCLLLTPSFLLHGADKSSGDQKDVSSAMSSLADAVFKKDRAMLDRLMHPDLTYTHSSGKTESKSEAIDGIVNAKGSQKIDFSESKVRTYKDVALVTGKVTLQPMLEGKPGNAFVLIISHVWLKGSQGWQLVNRQATRPTPAP